MPQEVSSNDGQGHISQDEIPLEPPATRCHMHLADTPARSWQAVSCSQAWPGGRLLGLVGDDRVGAACVDQEPLL